MRSNDSKWSVSVYSCVVLVLAFAGFAFAIGDRDEVTLPGKRVSSKDVSLLTIRSDAPLEKKFPQLKPQDTPQTEAKAKASFLASPLYFEKNVGQTDPAVRYISRGAGYTMFLTPQEVVFSLANPKNESKTSLLRDSGMPEPQRSHFDKHDSGKSDPLPISVLRMRVTGTAVNATPRVRSGQSLDSQINYFVGNDPKKWHTDVPVFGKVYYEGVYPGIDMVYYGNQTRLEYDFVLKPGADPDVIRLVFSGANDLTTDPDGNLLIHLPIGHILMQHAPVAYQTAQATDGPAGKRSIRVPVASRYVVSDSEGTQKQVTFAVGQYDHSKQLVIDPVLEYSTYLGGGGTDQVGVSIAVDSAGNTYVGGHTTSTNFPTLNPIPGSGGGDAAGTGFVTKLSAAGNQLVYSTYLGGTGDDRVTGIAVDASGNAYVAGYTTSTNFPTRNPIQTGNHGGEDGFVAKLSAAGNQLVYSTYIGGVANDNAFGVAVDAAGSTYVAGTTGSANFPLANPIQAVKQGTTDGFVAKLNPGGSQIAYATFLGGAGSDSVSGIAVDAAGAVYIAGFTDSADFPTRNAAQGANGGYYDGFVAKLNPGGSALLYSTYLGGAGYEYIGGVAIDGAGSAYVGGYTASADFPTLHAYQASNRGGNDGFVAKLTASGSQLAYSTYIGGASNDTILSVAVSAGGEAVVAGHTTSADFPTRNAFQPGIGGLYDGFVAKLGAPPLPGATAALLYSTYLGGSGYDFLFGVALDVRGDAYAGGFTASANFPTRNALQSGSGGGFGDGSVSKFAIGTPSVTVNPPTQSSGNVTITGTVNMSGCTIWVQLLDANGIVVAEGWATVNPDGTWTTNFPNVPPGTYTVRVVATSGSGQQTTVTGSGQIVVAPNAPHIVSLVLSPATVVGGNGQSINCVVTVKNAGSSSASPTVALSTSNAQLITVSSTTLTFGSMASGETRSRNTFLQTKSVASQTGVNITATLNGIPSTASITLNPPSFTGFSISPDRMQGGFDTRASVGLDAPAPVGGILVEVVSDNSSFASVPANVTVPHGAQTHLFAVTTYPVNVEKTVNITAKIGQTQIRRPLTVLPPAPVGNIRFEPSSINAGQPSTGTLTLSDPAPEGGVSVALFKTTTPASAENSIQIPNVAIVPAGSRIGTFTVTTTNTPGGKTVVVRCTNSPNVSGTLTVGGVPTAPQNLTATPANKKISLAWDAMVKATSYSVYRSTTITAVQYEKIASNIPANTPIFDGYFKATFIDRDVANGITYHYRVSASNDVGEGPMSNVASATPFSTRDIVLFYGFSNGFSNWRATYSYDGEAYTTFTGFSRPFNAQYVQNFTGTPTYGYSPYMVPTGETVVGWGLHTPNGGSLPSVGIPSAGIGWGLSSGTGYTDGVVQVAFQWVNGITPPPPVTQIEEFVYAGWQWNYRMMPRVRRGTYSDHADPYLADIAPNSVDPGAFVTGSVYAHTVDNSSAFGPTGHRTKPSPKSFQDDWGATVISQRRVLPTFDSSSGVMILKAIKLHSDFSATDPLISAPWDMWGTASIFSTVGYEATPLQNGVQEIKNLEYSLDGTTWQPVTGVLNVDQGSLVKFRAVRKVYPVGWTLGKPTWITDASVVGEETDGDPVDEEVLVGFFSSLPSVQTVRAQYDTQIMEAQINVHPKYSLTVLPNKSHLVPIGSDQGETVVNAVLSDPSGTAVANTVINFSMMDEQGNPTGTFLGNVNYATTDSNGRATITIRPSTVSSVCRITASATVNGNQLSATNFVLVSTPSADVEVGEWELADGGRKRALCRVKLYLARFDNPNDIMISNYPITVGVCAINGITHTESVEYRSHLTVDTASGSTDENGIFSCYIYYNSSATGAPAVLPKLAVDLWDEVLDEEILFEL